MQPDYQILPGLFIGTTSGMGRGVFTNENIDEGTIIEVAPVIVMNGDDRKLLDQTLLHDYIFEWGAQGKQCCMALGWIPIYNHAYRSNCEYEMDFESETIKVTTMRAIRKGEELFINYNGTWNNQKKLWFDAK